MYSLEAIKADEKQHDVHYLPDIPEGTRPPYELKHLKDGGTLILIWDHTVLAADYNHDTELVVTAGWCQIEQNGVIIGNQLCPGDWRVIPAESDYKITRLDIASGPATVKLTKYEKNYFNPDVYIYSPA